jgi:hypothetical protein
MNLRIRSERAFSQAPTFKSRKKQPDGNFLGSRSHADRKATVAPSLEIARAEHGHRTHAAALMQSERITTDTTSGEPGKAESRVLKILCRSGIKTYHCLSIGLAPIFHSFEQKSSEAF